MNQQQAVRAALATVGTVATAAGAASVLRGAAEVRGGSTPSASLDSEYRFYASWYAVMGVLLLKAARSPERAHGQVAGCGLGFGLAVVGRVLSRRAHGRPHWLYRLLTAIEVVLPVLVPWHRRAFPPTSGSGR